MERTTELNKIKDGYSYTWGEVVTIHEIGEYSIIESIDWKTKGVEVLVGQVGTIHKFHPYIAGKNISRGYSSLEEAIVGAIGYKYDGPNSQAASYFSKMIDMPNNASLKN